VKSGHHGEIVFSILLLIISSKKLKVFTLGPGK